MTQARVIPKADETPMKTDAFTGTCSWSCSCVGTTRNKVLFCAKAVRTVTKGEESHCIPVTSLLETYGIPGRSGLL